ncbi:Flagellar FliJ protein [Buchnera aphidicola (Cinara cuneomaculata)]|uniref:Flagellar FliJ protein n=2 Tax=Buchnera aphidicola TaxID=9 RepID=A0A451CXD9_9GAMM|nr:Flagellar FliJ protein [Buchnera aphidicola (Cinara cuneomaculata)]
MILNMSSINVFKKKIEIDIHKNIFNITRYKNKKTEIQKYLLQLKEYKNKYIFLLSKKFFSGVTQHRIQFYFNFILMLQKLIDQQNIWLNYFKQKLKKRLLIQYKLNSTLEQWKKLELRLKNRIIKEKILIDQRNDNAVCLNFYSILTLK